jgi:ketosteroid isomerase-like protein
MSSKSWFVAALLGVVVGFFARGMYEAPARARSAPAVATSGISDLHDRDRAATLSGDAKALADLWTTDAVRMEPGQTTEVGRASIFAADARDQARRPKGWTVLSYEPDIRQVSVHGDWAVEWGYFTGLWRRSPKARPTPLHGKLLRVMRRDSDGKWRFTHVMWNTGS